MKAIKTLIILLFVSFGFATLNEAKAQDVDVAVNFNMFQEDLSPYGTRVDNPRFGEVWVYEDPNFKPYNTDGHWEYTNYGWSWVSDFDWGWAPFHYGRWEYDPFVGWMWIPGYEWASAWVSWSSYDDYYGWAPLGFGVGINVSFGSIPYDRWNFVPRRNICEREVTRYCVPATRNYGFRNAVVINNYYQGREGRFMRGPDRSEVQRYTHNRIEERRVSYRGRPENMSRNNEGRNGNGQRRFDNANNGQDNRMNRQRGFDNNQQQGNGNPNNGQDRMNRQRRFDNNQQQGNGNQNNGPDRIDRQPRADNPTGNTNNPMSRINEQRRMENERQQQMMNEQRRSENERQQQRMNEQRRSDNERQQQMMNEQRRQENNRQIERQQQPQRQMDPVREQRNQPSMERPRMEQRQEPNNNNGNGQGRQRNNDNNQSQRPNRFERRGK